jgi:hypothetical protein
MISQKDMRDGESRELIRSLCKTIIDDPRIGPIMDAIPEQDTSSVLAKFRNILRGDDIYRLTRI